MADEAKDVPTGGTPDAPSRESSGDQKLDKKNRDIAKDVKAYLDPAKRAKETLRSEWRRNIELRSGHLSTTFTGGLDVEDDIRSEINPDWSLTKTKTANLFSQTPRVQGSHENAQYAPAVPPFIKELNYQLGEKRCDTGTAVEEVLNDVVNAAGIGAVVVGYDATFEEVPMPVEAQIQLPNFPQPIPTSKLNDEQLQKLAAAGLVHLQMQERPVSQRFYTDRISPNDLIWQTGFTGSNFDNSDLIGYEGRCSFVDGMRMFKLSEEDKDNVIAADPSKRDDLRTESDTVGSTQGEKKIKFTRLFYWRHRFDGDEKYFDAIWELVYVEGKTDPVVHEPWKGQRFDKQTKQYIGCKKFPVRVLTLTYITDNPVPPSDSAASRPHVNDLRRSRSMLFAQRERSTPIRWFDVNRIDHTLQNNLMRGTVQGMIPTNGDGSRAIGEIARASYPAEDFTFDQITKSDLMESWQIDPVMQGQNMPGGRQNNAIVQQAGQARATRIGQERNRVVKWFLGICEVLAGFMVLYSDFPSLTDKEKQAMQQVWDYRHITHDIVLKIRPDSQIVLESGQRIQKLMNFTNMTVKSGFVNPKPLITELAELHDLDPNEVVVDPQPKKPEEPNISLRLTGRHDLDDPLVVAMMMKHDQMPGPEHMDAAKKLLAARQQPPTPESPAGPEGPAGETGAPSAVPPPTAGGRPVEGAPQGEAHSKWQLGSRVSKRSRDVSGG